MRNLLIILSLIFSYPCICQKDFKLYLKSTEGSIKIRWTPPNSAIWLSGLDKGYRLERAEYLDGVSYENLNYEEITAVPIKQWSEKEWDAYESSLNNNQFNSDEYLYASVAFSIVKEKEYLQKGANFNDVMKYKKELEEAYFYSRLCSVQSWNAAKSLSIAFEDYNVVKGKEYVYRLIPLFKENGVDFKNIFARIHHVDQFNPELGIIQVEELDERIVLSWVKRSLNTSYKIEVSIDEKNYVLDNERPLYKMYSSKEQFDSLYTYEVDSLINFQKYFFRVTAKDIFGDESTFGIADGTPTDLTPPTLPRISKIDGNTYGEARIEWDFPENENSEIRGFKIGRSNSQTGDYVQIHEGYIPGDWRAFDDKYFSTDTTNFYRVGVEDLFGNSSISEFYFYTSKDSFPPEQPINISGNMDSTGLVTLVMEAQQERDFMGYRVYKSNNPTAEFAVVQETYNDSFVSVARNPIIIDTSTVESLSPYLYYKVGALDYHYNESKSSDIIKVKRPDKYPPVPPMITGYKALEDHIHFNIALSSSFDVQQNYIYRRKASEDDWVVLDSLGIGFNATYVDSTGESGIYYDYSLRAIDLGGLESDFGNAFKLKTLASKNQIPINVVCRFSEESSKALINWEFTAEEYMGAPAKIIINNGQSSLTYPLHLGDYDALEVNISQLPQKLTIINQSRKFKYTSLIVDQCSSVDSDLEQFSKNLRVRKYD